MPQLSQAALATWRPHLASGGKLDENEAMRLLREFQSTRPIRSHRSSTNRKRARLRASSAIPSFSRPPMRGVDHKSDRDGVNLNIEDEAT